jgi:hypothetical protein
MRSARQTKTVVATLALAVLALGSLKLAYSAPAPPLRAVVVEAVASSKYPTWEPIPTGGLSTTRDHSGTWLKVQTREDGYGQNQIARFNSYNMRLIQSVAVVDAGRNIVGWHRVWQYTGSFSSGRFTFQANSLVGIPSVRSTALSIR